MYSTPSKVMNVGPPESPLHVPSGSLLVASSPASIPGTAAGSTLNSVAVPDRVRPPAPASSVGTPSPTITTVSPTWVSSGVRLYGVTTGHASANASTARSLPGAIASALTWITWSGASSLGPNSAVNAD